MARTLREEYEEWGLILNSVNTKYLSIGKSEHNLSLQGNYIIKHCDSYKYWKINIYEAERHDWGIQDRICL
jgi:hypothetical protein